MGGTVTISVEVELGWGLHQIESHDTADRLSPGRKRETDTLETLLSVCDDWGIPISFGVVGHLLLESCAGDHSGPHPEGWFDPDPGGDIDSHPLFYAPDIVKQIEAARVDHEICTHTFSHAPSHTIGEEVLDWELETIRRLHADAGLPAPRSFVPPVHAPPPYEVLEKNGISTVRLPVRYEFPVKHRNSTGNRVSGLYRRVRHSHPAQVLFRSHPIYKPQVVDGILETRSTWHASLTAPFLPNGGVRPHAVYRAVPTTVRQRVHNQYLRRGLRAAVEQNSYTQFWSHLFNLANDTQLSTVRSFLEHIGERQARDEVTVETLGSLGKNIQKGRQQSTSTPN